jgi:hypothetical protein
LDPLRVLHLRFGFRCADVRAEMDASAVAASTPPVARQVVPTSHHNGECSMTRFVLDLIQGFSCTAFSFVLSYAAWLVR